MQKQEELWVARALLPYDPDVDAAKTQVEPPPLHTPNSPPFLTILPTSIPTHLTHQALQKLLAPYDGASRLDFLTVPDFGTTSLIDGFSIDGEFDTGKIVTEEVPVDRLPVEFPFGIFSSIITSR